MDEKTQAENEALRELFQHPGWAVLERNTRGQIEQFRSGFPFNVKTIEQLYFAQGLYAALSELLAMPQRLEELEVAVDQQDIPPEDDV